MPPLDAVEVMPLILRFDEVGPNDLPRVGGKGQHLGELTRAGFPVPAGFCVTTAGYQRFLAALPDAQRRFAALDEVDGRDATQARLAAEQMRAALADLPLPGAVGSALLAAWRQLGPEHPLAVRSSATAEDLPGASFAGQQDTYLNVHGEEALLDAVRRCWISLFTDRAVLYRARNGFGHRAVSLAVVVQRLVDPEVSGILFTADPVSGHRGTISIDAGFGLGEALVGGLISADLYRVDRQRREVTLAQPGDKAFAIRSTPEGGTRQEPLPEAQRRARALTDAQVLALAELAERIEAHAGGVPQDIEWCLAGGALHILQTRPITSLYPIPASSLPSEGLRLFTSFGHVQMMPEAMPRLAREVWQYFFPAGKGGAITLGDRPQRSPAMVEAGSRLFIDVTEPLRHPKVRAALLSLLGVVYENVALGLAALTQRPTFREATGGLPRFLRAVASVVGPVFAHVPAVLWVFDPVRGAAQTQRAVEDLQAAARARVKAAPSSAARLRQATVEFNGIFAQVRGSLARLAGAVIAHRLLKRLAQGPWADEVREQVDTLLRGLPGNVTTEMDLAVGDLTDLARSHPALAQALRVPLEAGSSWSSVRAMLTSTPQGPVLLSALDDFLVQYGDRGVGEIDLSRPRWRDDPSVVLRVISGGLADKPTGAHRRHHQAQVAQGEAAVTTLVEAAGRGGHPLRRWVVSRLARVARAGLGLREHPKFMLVRVLGVVRAEALAAGETLRGRGQLRSASDVFHLGFDEVMAALDDPTRQLQGTIVERAQAFARDQARTAPFVISSEGETPTLTLNRDDLPAGALPGTAASNGVVEGLARVVLDPEREILQAGEILVARFTDPGWTPLFVHAAGVVTEVGGLMTHGAVVAREYGIPAVVSVAGAVSLIHTGQRIRVEGTRGFVQLLEGP